MKRAARLRASPIMSKYQRQPTNKNVPNEPIVRTTGRIKKPKAVFDPSDNYLPRSQRLPAAASTTLPSAGCTSNTSQDRRSSLNQTPSAASDKNLVSKELCMVCGKHVSKRTSIALKNPLLSCLECESKIHWFCLKSDFDDFEHVRQTYKCENCILCEICLKNNHADEGDNQVVTCSKCLKGFHMQCLQTCPSGSPGLNWKCPRCDLVIESAKKGDLPVKKIREIIGDHAHTDFPPIKTESNDALPASKFYATSNISSAKGPRVSDIQDPIGIMSDESVSAQMSITEDSSIGETKKAYTSSQTPPKVNEISDEPLDDLPDVKDWSVYQVYEYIRIYFPDEADVFKEQEIDGRSLLLLRRSDVVNNLPLKLGPSLRIYSFILKLQGRKNDPTLGWNCSV